MTNSFTPATGDHRNDNKKKISLRVENLKPLF